MGEIEFFDSHGHYDDEKFEVDRDVLINSMYKENITGIINAGYDEKSSEKAVTLAKKYSFIYSTSGISPNDYVKDYKLEKIYELAKSVKNVAIGEIGLDYYWNKENKEEQKKLFIEQIELANDLKLPIVIHNREADQDTVDIIKNTKKSFKSGVFHCCSLEVELVKEVLKLEYYISIAGPITYKNAKKVLEVVKYVPLEKILIETDAPYLSPEPYRGTRNDARNLKFIAGKIAEIKNVTINEVASITYKNTKRIFEINEHTLN